MTEISLERRGIDGLDFTFITKPGVGALRAAVVLPFESQELMPGGRYKEETSHLFEHVACSGDGSTPPGTHRAQISTMGGSMNAQTDMSMNGYLAFETIQPDDGLHLVKQFIRGVFTPGLQREEIEAQRIIVENELHGYLQNPRRQRINKLLHFQGRRYTTEPISIVGLDLITPDDIHSFYADLVVANNARFVLAGDRVKIDKLLPELIAIGGERPVGNKVYSDDELLRDQEDYHAPAAEIPAGMTEYSQTTVVEGNALPLLELPEARVVMAALVDFINTGSAGLHEQSRARGLSYGVNARITYKGPQTFLGLSDTTRSTNVGGQLALLSERLTKVEQYSAEDYRDFAQKVLGSLKIYPEDVFKFAGTVEQNVGKETFEIITQAEFRDALLALPPNVAVKGIKDVASQLRCPTYVNRTSFGDNPFS